MERSSALVVPTRNAEKARRALQSRKMERRDLKIRRDGDDVWIPVSNPDGDPPAGGRWDEGAFETRRTVRSYKDVVDVPDELRDDLPTSFDVIGDVVLIKIPDEFAPYAQAIGQAIRQAHPSVRAVYADEGVTGRFRVRDVRLVAGKPGTRTVHTEFGRTFEVDVAKAYFSPRLAGEHERVARLVEAGDRVLDATAGVGPYTVAVAKRRPEATVVAVDLNPEAVALLRSNVQRNGVGDRVEVVAGDGFQVAVEGAPWDRIVVNLPHGEETELGAAAATLAEEGTLHATRVLRDADARDGIEAFARRAGCRVAHLDSVHAYSPDASLYAFDLVRRHG